MDIEDLPEEIREMVEGLKDGAATIECYVKDALEIAEDTEDFKERVSCEMASLIAEAQEVMNTLGNKPETKNIIIRIDGGVINEINNIPLGLTCEVRDYDVEGADDERITVVDGEEGVVSLWKGGD